MTDVHYDPDLPLHYRDLKDTDAEAHSLEVSVIVISENGEDRDEMTWDNLTFPMWFIVKNDLKVLSEYLDHRLEILVKDGERELRGTEGTAIDGVTAQQILDGWREAQGSFRLVIEVEGDPKILGTVFVRENIGAET